MAYTKTVWDNDVTAVDETNMNKIEDGLFNQDARITITEAEASGWTVLPATLTYASATTMNTSVDLTGILQVGDKIKLTQTNAKYFYVIAITSNLITVTGGSDYTVESATITSPYYSHQENPLGFPTMFNHTIVWSGGSGSAGSFSYTSNFAKFRLVGNMCEFICSGKFNNLGSWSGIVSGTLPIVANTTDDGYLDGAGICANTTSPYATTKGKPKPNLDKFRFLSSVNTDVISWAALAVNDNVYIQGKYPIT